MIATTLTWHVIAGQLSVIWMKMSQTEMCVGKLFASVETAHTAKEQKMENSELQQKWMNVCLCVEVH